VALEQFMSMLLAPTMMLFHCTFVLRALIGRNVGWDAQSRSDRGVGWLEALRRHKWHLLLGMVWGAAMLALAPRFIGWMLPVIAGMLISVPFTVLTSRASLGRALRRRGLFLTPEETCPPPELAALQAAEPLKPVMGFEPMPPAVPERAPLTMIEHAPSYVRPFGPTRAAALEPTPAAPHKSLP
jgi:membrane glycosyltransferase